MDAEIPILDLSFLYEISDNDEAYIYDVLKLFLDSAQPGVSALAQAINDTNDFSLIAKKAHFLKSSASIIQIREMHNNLTHIEHIAKENIGNENASKSEIINILDNLTTNFTTALPLIIAEKDRIEQQTKS
jgi:HPt (histidine-containing phosphotransfer) domain-containing protein